jgi:Barstar (barnase inhibitor)
MLKLDINVDECKNKEDLIIKFYDSLGITSPRGLNWDALDENMRNLKNVSKISMNVDELCLSIFGISKLKTNTTDNTATVFKELLVDATDTTNRIDNLILYIRISAL